jgi:uncharacterized protein
MSSSQRLVAISTGFLLVAAIAIAAIVVASNRPTLLVSAATTSSTTVEVGIHTSGDAIVSKKPDLAIVSAGVQSQQGTAAAAQSDLAAKTAKLVARIKALGVADKDLSTSGYWVGPVYDQAGQSVSGYRASEQLNIKWHNVDTVGKTLDAIVQEGGATNIGVSFGLADPKAAQAEARSLAIADARSRAQAMASAAGVRLGPVISISDLSTSSRPPVGYAAASDAKAVTQIPVGEMDVQVTVEVDFALG